MICIYTFTAEILKNANHNSSVINVDSIRSVKEDSTEMTNDFKTQTVKNIDNRLILHTSDFSID